MPADLDPYTLDPAHSGRYYGALKTRERIIRLVELRVRAGDIVQKHRIVGIDVETPLCVFHGLLGLAKDRIRDGRKDTRSRVVGRELELLFGESNSSSVSRFALRLISHCRV